MVEELKKLTGRVQLVEGGKGIEGLNYEDLCIQPDVELTGGYKPPKFEWIGKDERIRMKMFMRSLAGDALSLYISQNLTKWVNWKKPIETFHEYATRWRYEAAKVRPALEEEQMNKFFVRAQDPHYYERLMVIENHKFSYIVNLGERIEKEIKSGMMTNIEALQATNKSLQSGGISKKKEVGAVMVAQGLYEIRVGSMNGQTFDGSQMATIGKINLSLQMGPTWFDVEFQLLDISVTYNLLLGDPGYMSLGP
uniref:Uncharacterized protein LOC104230270 n=1 Tax=Nicotiana sylvestris TaxID=4096 RepID=A0A1U7WVJ5_NICSY|nr:PREDICTED: uncharacterized protein LOC104230270 [Nicotiana sylvestris]